MGHAIPARAFAKELSLRLEPTRFRQLEFDFEDPSGCDQGGDH
jgi:hypothetical protein